MPYHFEIFQEKSLALGRIRRWWWRLKAGNNEIMAGSTEGYDSEQNVLRAIGRVKEEVAAAKIYKVES